MFDCDYKRGRFILIISCVIFLYYTIWVIGLPFIEDTTLRNLFYSHDVALIIPAVSSFCFIGGLILFTFYNVYPYLTQYKMEKRE